MQKQAIILIAGRSTRIRSIVKNNPKCLMKFGSYSLIDIQISSLMHAGIKNIIFVVGYRANKIIKHLDMKYPRNKFIYLHNKNWSKTNVAGSLYVARDFLPRGGLILHGDILFSTRMLEKLIKKDCPGARLVVQKKRCGWEEMKYVSNTNKKRIILLTKDVSPKLAEGEFMGIVNISRRFGKKFKSILEDTPFQEFKDKFYEWGLLKITYTTNLPLQLFNASCHPIIEIDFPKDYIYAKNKIFPEILKNSRLDILP
jgi:choline kinase